MAGSFRDPSGFVFKHDNTLYRQVNVIYQEHFDRLMESGLYRRLVKSGQLIPHVEADLGLAQSDDAYQIIRPDPVPFVSYPYEWSFSQLKDAALVTLDIQKQALEMDMSLKDASAYNIQFVNGRPTLIDTLSFEVYQEGLPWIAYRQFCQHFLAPLALMSCTDVRLSQLLRVYIDGVPLDLAAALLPFRSRLNAGLLMHIHLHAAGQRRFAGAEISRDAVEQRISRQSLLGIVGSLANTVRKLEWNPESTAWAGYYEDDSYTDEGLRHKQQLVEEFLDALSPKVVWDLGANVGRFSRIASRKGILAVALDGDPGAVDMNYRQAVRERDTHLLPLLVDLTNPSPAIGWENAERMSLAERGPADALLALALVHHLAIANNTPLASIASYMASLGRGLVIEFVPKTDPKVRRLLASREDIFPQYTQEGFEAAFGAFFDIERTTPINHSERILYLMRKR